MFFRKKEKEITKDKKSIPTPLPDDESGLIEFIDTIKKTSGVDLRPKQEVIKERLGNFAQVHHISSFKALNDKILSDHLLRQETLNLITVNETYFYRELLQLEGAIGFAKTLQKNIRILSAPCSSGEEVYSIGMLAYEMGLNLNQIKIYGIDINSDAIEKSLQGLYSSRSLHRLNDNLKSKFFDVVGNDFKIKKRLLPECEFRQMNIFDENFLNLGTFDIVFSRNMMIYFDATYRLKTIQRFHKILNTHGRLYVGHADLIPNTDLFNKNMADRIIYYQKL
ncbi:protein-glutamate O-methyltransferase CheR [Helicobacter sp. 11S03491-1]|uniref:CheR family methyltransferase n=1 Tax=Helicobacter sp. 11S03491-1 TaxID=1476196 RepID=UPI000BA76389|nr:protein-glutamate O-methyltransferase CheR [Helicobacter sp. 11S03491-1]PAF42987.1 SAM-dependent methyltransferase [Helicobacter sp. 11S03491-1]